MSQLQLAAQQVDEALDRLESVLQQRTALGLDVHLQQELATLQADNEALRETERVLVPEGHVIVAGYNAIGLMGAWNLLRRRGAPWNGRFHTASRVRDWLSVLGFDTVASEGCFFRPPLRSGRIMRRLEVFETAGPRFWPRLCGTWFLVARKRTATLTPLRPSWRRRRKPIREAGLAGPAMTVAQRSRLPADDAA